MFTPTDITIQSTTLSDVPNLSKIQEAAYRGDLVSHLMTLDRPEEWSYGEWLKRMIEHSFQDHSIVFIKAVENSTGRTVGWASWAVKGGEEEKTRPNDSRKAEPQKTVMSPSQSATGEVAEINLAPSLPSELGRQKLGALIASDYIAQYNNFASSTNGKHLVLEGLFVLPTFQGRGIGTALVAHFTQEADREGLSCWVHASPASQLLYVKAGFNDVARKEFDLAEFVERGTGKGWGVYVFRYMVRGPQLASLVHE